MLCNGPLKHGASLFIEAVGAGNYGRGSLEPHSGHLAWLGLEPSPRIFLSWTKPSTYQAFPLSSRLIPLQLAPTIPFSSVHTSSYSFQLPASCSYSFQLPAHTASSFQLIQLPASSSYSIQLPAHTASSFQLIQLPASSSYSFQLPAHTASSFQHKNNYENQSIRQSSGYMSRVLTAIEHSPWEIQ